MDERFGDRILLFFTWTLFFVLGDFGDFVVITLRSVHIAFFMVYLLQLLGSTS